MPVKGIRLAGVADKIPVDLHGPAATMLTTLYLKALDADFTSPVLGDRYAQSAVERIDFDWDALKAPGRWAPLVTVRTAQYDIWARQFLSAHPQATVIHLGCGLDARVFRINPGPQIAWYDVDQPPVIALREQVYPTRDGYHLVATSATDPSWLDEIPADRPVLLLAEGISMYLTQADGVALLQSIVDRFPSGELQIDFYNWLGVKSQKTHRLQRQSGATLHWAVNSPRDILDSVNGIRLLAATDFFYAETFSRVPAGFRRVGRVARSVPPLRGMLQYHRYAFGSLS